MRSTFELTELETPAQGSVVSIGVFDGVHLGHRAILARNVAIAQELGAEPAVVTFRRHPKSVLLGHAPRTLTSLDHRLELFQRAGVEHTVALQFDEALRRLSAEDFAETILRRGLDARHVVLGFDSKFGHDREGTPEFLAARGYRVTVVPQVVVRNRAVSSTAIREAVELGDLVGAEAMLGRPVAVLGRVVHGRHLGRELGFPTANLDLHHELHPPPGVYACRVHRLTEVPGGTRPRQAPLPAVANVGFRPTVEGERPELPQVEVHLLDFAGDLYSERLEVEFVSHLRDERRFDGVEALSEQIGRDVEQARVALATH